MKNIDALKERIHALETERSELAAEVENLRKAAEAHASLLEDQIRQMREEAKTLRSLVGAQSAEDPEPPAESVMDVSVNEEAEAVSKVGTVEEETQVDEPNASSKDDSSISNYESILQDLGQEEKKAIDVLRAHNGKCTQKSLRAEAGLSWLQTSRVVSHLIEQGIIEKADGTNIQLTEKMQSDF